ncbi:MAG: cbb3-type cytochrome c oxidase subunit 3 [Alphaproteobacteria bacterium]|nr:cbb3-type cytochrome c oxidase subunit 3 [Alphaproteobacteria bacterium]
MRFATVILWLQQHSILLVLPVFVLIFMAAYWPGHKRRIERHALIPFEDER